MHKATLVLKLEFFQFVKIFAHNQALYHPLQRQAGQSEISRRAFSANIQMILPVRAWQSGVANWRSLVPFPKRLLYVWRRTGNASVHLRRAARQYQPRKHPVGKARS